MKIIDFERKGNMVRFYLGEDADTEYHGDDWNDCPYDCNAGTVYSEYVTGTVDLFFPFDALVLEPCCGAFNCRYCKDDMKDGIVPCIIVVPGCLAEETWESDFDYWASCKGILKFYMNDQMEPAKEPALYCFDPEEEVFLKKSFSTFVIRQNKSDAIPYADRK